MNHLILKRTDLTQKYRDIPISEVDLNKIDPSKHADYYYADLVIFAGNNIGKILKTPVSIPDPYIRIEDLDFAISVISENFHVNPISVT